MNNRRPAEVFPPGEYLKDELEERDWTQADLAEIIGRPIQLVNEIITGKRGITPETAKGLAAAFGTSAEIWLNLETAYRLWKSGEDKDEAVERRANIYSKGPIKEMVKRGWIEYSESVDVLEKRVCDFFGLRTIEDQPKMLRAAHKSTSYVEATPAQIAWLCRAKHLANGMKVASFSKTNLAGAVTDLKRLLQDPMEARHVPQILGDAGIRFLVVEPLPNTKIDGACFWLDDNSPVIALALRFDRIDNFWFTLAHELSHARSAVQALDVDIENKETERPDIEITANEFAAEFLVPQERLMSFISLVGPIFRRNRIEEFAETVNVHPGIVIGQLQHRNLIYSPTFRQYLAPIREIVTAAALTDGWGVSVGG